MEGLKQEENEMKELGDEREKESPWCGERGSYMSCLNLFLASNLLVVTKCSWFGIGRKGKEGEF